MTKQENFFEWATAIVIAVGGGILGISIAVALAVSVIKWGMK